MSSAGPQQSEGNQVNGSHRASRGLRSLPGFTTAAVVFVLIVLLGVGGVAIANWNQTATVAIAITAGAAATTSPPPTTAPPTTTPPTTAPPTTTPPTTAPPTVPPAGPGNIVAKPVIATRPGTVSRDNLRCTVAGESGNFTIGWAAVPTLGVKYVVSLKSIAPAAAFQATSTVTSTTTSFSLEGKVHGIYLLRIQAMNGTIAGDPVYWNLRHGGKDSSGCDWGASDGQPPLGAFSVNAGPAKQEVVVNASLSPNANQVNLSFVGAAGATDYVVSVQSTTTASSYGAEYRATAPGSTLTFPLRAFQNGQPAASAAFYGQYIVRVIPMNGSAAGDPVYKIVQYGQSSTEVWDWAIGWG